jgi:hypothetical protein
LRRALAALTWFFLLGPPAGAGAMEPVDPVKELQLLRQGVTPPKHLADASFRVAVFSFEDPDGLGLGSALSALAGHEILAGALVQSIGVILYTGPLTPQPGDDLGYFDMVEKLAEGQEPTVSVWGMVRRDGQELVVDTWLQIPAESVGRGLQVRLRLPSEMGRGELVARLGGDRLLLQRHRLPLAAAADIRAGAAALADLHARPAPDAPVVRLPAEALRYVRDRSGDWVQIAAGNRSGWAPIRGHCRGACAPLLDPIRFVSALLRFMEQRIAPEAPPTLAPDACALAAQILAAQAFDRAPPDVGRALEILAPWLPGSEGPGAAVAGAAAANLRLVGRMRAALWHHATDRPPAPLPSPATVRGWAFEAADATAIDPRNLELLHDLQVLYQAVRDGERAALAGKLLEKATASSRLRLLPPSVPQP